ncbi:small metal-binding protein SmbP [Candidatus Methylocalor cossyra]|uniref:Small metal-binding protein n=1 Tax=Candidatus Methylocalor cossyra TaxID=3108543 RepID=A0ABM9NKG9_9GAMM
MKAILMGLALALSATGSLAAEKPEDHLGQAERHTNAAVAQGKTGNTQGLVEHAETALKHLDLAQQEKPRPDLDKAAASLKNSIRLGKDGDPGKATEHAQEAVEYIDAAKGALGG